ncbi:hypothetical protein B0T11DRAFT_281160 [Plectosphaerella cucumerina]|uniref:Uncharacterized protein n=1 Tax=Plectosphaerella cucumerina TaxID=40658 RepID=A0A8K0TEU0_9PEZI|nr:hypothetical protein B0T11DRAFT_281160 [Plectosphaerella cucumerina]
MTVATEFRRTSVTLTLSSITQKTTAAQPSGRPPLKCRVGKSPREGLRQRLGRRETVLGERAPNGETVALVYHAGCSRGLGVISLAIVTPLGGPTCAGAARSSGFLWRLRTHRRGSLLLARHGNRRHAHAQNKKEMLACTSARTRVRRKVVIGVYQKHTSPTHTAP